MTRHRHYYELSAESHADLGVQKGKLFGSAVRASLKQAARDKAWNRRRATAQAYLEPARDAFPHLIEELEGYARGADVSFDDLWLLSMEDELTQANRCTTAVTNHGYLVAHNEDWDQHARHDICILRRTIRDFSVLELFYLGTLGGNSISWNSHGFVHAVNSLSATDGQVGIPRNVIARWLSDTTDPDRDYERLGKLRRASGYHHTIVDKKGKVWSLECSAQQQQRAYPPLPFVHTNHLLGDLAELDDDNGDEGTRERWEFAKGHVGEQMSVQSLDQICRDTSHGRNKSVFNKRTIARVVIDVDHAVAHFWMLREAAQGMQAYPWKP